MNSVKRAIRGVAKSALRCIPLKRQIFQVLRRSGTLPESVYQHLHFNGPISVPVDDVRKFDVYHWGNQIENDIFWAGLGNNWEATSVLLWLHLARNADTVLDVGANTGVFALCAQTVNPDAVVYAFEPVPRVFDRLQRNIDMNNFAISAARVGVSNENGTATMFDVPTEHVYSASLERDRLAGRSDTIETEVDIVRLDTFLQTRKVGGCMLVKIDTERHEFQVLEGFGEIIATHRPIFMVEILDRTIGQQVESCFEGLDYVWMEVLEGQGLRPAAHLGEAERNYLICPNDVAEELHTYGISHTELDPRRIGLSAGSGDKSQ